MSVTIAVQLFGPGFPSAGRAGTLRVQGHNLHVVSGELERFVACKSCEAVKGGFDHDRLQLQWPTESGEALFAALARDDAAQAALLGQLSALPPGTMPTLAAWQRATGKQRWVWRAAIGTVAATALAAVLVVWQRERVVNWMVWAIPQKVETRIGQGVLAELKDDKRITSTGPVVEAMNSIGKRLTAGSAYTYQWHVVEDESVNAFALPGGIIVVHSGLLKLAGSADELAGVLAHEVEHVEQRHAMRNMVNQAGLAAAMLVILGDVNTIVVLLAHQAGAQFFSRSLESEADLAGARRLHERKFLLEPMRAMYEKLQAKPSSKSDDAEEKTPGKPAQKTEPAPKSANAPLAWLSSHPQINERVSAIGAFIQSNPCADCRALDIDWNAVRAAVAAAGKREGGKTTGATGEAGGK